jgi:alpha-glucosidase (family GH31 glycosyl hydrolase)
MVQSATSIADYAGIYFHNSNAAAPILQFDAAPAKTSTFSYITTGGVVEMFVFGYGSPSFIVKQYHNIIGYPQLPPYWSLGYHQGSAGYNSADRIKAVVDQHKNNKFPLDAIWFDTVAQNANGEDFVIDVESIFPSDPKKGYSV